MTTPSQSPWSASGAKRSSADHAKSLLWRWTQSFPRTQQRPPALTREILSGRAAGRAGRGTRPREVRLAFVVIEVRGTELPGTRFEGRTGVRVGLRIKD